MQKIDISKTALKSNPFSKSMADNQKNNKKIFFFWIG